MSRSPLVRIFSTLLLALTLLMPVAARDARLEQSVQPLQFEGQTFCTAFSINEHEGLWATAKHCAVFVLEKHLTVTIGGVWAQPVYLAAMDDVAIYQSARHAPALRLASRAPAVGDTIRVEGYPYGLFRLIEARGYVAARMEPTDNGISDVLDVTVAGGNSGSPVLNASGDVVGVLWGKFQESDHALSVPLETVSRELGAAAQR